MRSPGVLAALIVLVLLPAAPAATLTAEDWIDRGDRFVKYEQHNTAVECYTRAIGIDPHDAAAYFKRCLAYEALGELEYAVADVTTAIGLDPANYRYCFFRGFLYNVERKYHLAVVDLDMSIALEPNVKRNGRAYIERGCAYHNLGGYDPALADFTAYIGANPDDGEAYCLRGKTYQDSGDIENAKKDYRKACSLGDTVSCRLYDILK